MAYRDRRGKVITRERWCELIEMPGYSQLWTRTFDETITISTIWLGMNHNFGQGEAMIFETQVFEVQEFEEPARSVRQERYATEEDALKGHFHLVAVFEGHWGRALRIAQSMFHGEGV